MPKKGDKGHEVRMIQVELGIEDDGHYGSETEEAVKEFQENNGLVADGIAGQKTIEKLFPSTDLQESDAWIEEYHLPMGQYCGDFTEKEYIFIHHTAGWNNPYKVIDQWARDSRGRIATQYVIGGPHPKTGDEKYDGVVLEAFSSNNWAYHLGKNGSSYMHSHSVGIEVCNFGPLTKDGDNYYTWAGTLLPAFEVCDLGEEWRGYRYWHNYSEEQIISLGRLIKHIAKEHGIDLNKGLKEGLLNEKPFRAFDYKEDAYFGKIKGILSHSNTRKDKTDMYPHPQLVEMLKNLKND